MNQDDTRSILGLEPEDLDGHSIEELSDYLDAGRRPPNRAIDESARCQNALDALQRLRNITPALLASDLAAEPEPQESWIQGILGSIALDARAGRRIPITATIADADLGITEGAVRGLIRAAESSLPGVVVGRCTLDGDVTEPGAEIRVSVELSVPYGADIPETVDRLRGEITQRIAAHTTLNLSGVDVAVQDVQYAPNRSEERL